MKQKENLRKEDGVEKVDEVQFRKLVGCLDSCIVQVNCLSRLLRECSSMSKEHAILASNIQETRNSSWKSTQIVTGEALLMI